MSEGWLRLVRKFQLKLTPMQYFSVKGKKTFNPYSLTFSQNPIPNKKCTKREVLDTNGHYLDFSQVRNPRGVEGVGGVGGWEKSLTPHTMREKSGITVLLP
ncbi:hypothetical protein CDG76_12315 [Nostoc sp. 'Peltigera membranacea cyanobiont' 210A]|uniref:hypothetical protein n=1 Tax=Nostoc sp. 'Peltigera membranacea cyanobiont' 210A TaxID=2014529 RepID=UPI000B956092|nr:hypothetical protein [Nostoc sp. 'Peltigera membranacea cyanobiont' 210A]OYD95710.1 hypothetical protein CDG76_12315 [Nostoc sp. 'Peltigera membranacea cyanobiont' 210A]